MKHVLFLSLVYVVVFDLVNLSFCSPASNTTSNPIDWVCPEGYNGVVRHPYDCQLFFHCSATGKPLALTCPRGQYFNPVTEYCEMQENVPDCQGGSPPTTSPTQQPSTKAL